MVTIIAGETVVLTTEKTKEILRGHITLMDTIQINAGIVLAINIDPIVDKISYTWVDKNTNPDDVVDFDEEDKQEYCFFSNNIITDDDDYLADDAPIDPYVYCGVSRKDFF